MIGTGGKLREIQNAILDCFQKSVQPLTMGQIRAWIDDNYQSSSFDPNTVYQQIRGSCANLASAYKHRRDTPKILIYDPASRTYRLGSAEEVSTKIASAESPSTDDEESTDKAEPSATFVLESHFRDFLARDLSHLEKGLTLWSHDPPSVEYTLDGRRIDLLAKDSSGVPVIIELKLNRAYDRVIGQALLYRNLVRKSLNVSKVRVLIVASEIAEELQVAAEEIADVEFFEYKLLFQVSKVGNARRYE